MTGSTLAGSPRTGWASRGGAAGEHHVVVSAVAPLWVDAAAVGKLGEPGVTYAEYLTWTAGLLATNAPLAGALDTVAVCGEPVRVLGNAGPLLRVELPAQPNGEAGYLGLMDPRHVGVDSRLAVTHVVVAQRGLRTTAWPTRGSAPTGRATSAHTSAEGLVAVPAGATVEQVRDVGDGVVEVRHPGGDLLACSDRDLRPAPGAWWRGGGDRRMEPAVVTAGDLVAIATEFVGSPYLWGGIEAAGIDCSGLVHTTYRIAGRVVPRDAHHQWAALWIDISWKDLRPGDLLFFGDHAGLDGIDHVGFYVGDMQILHAPETGRHVVSEPISGRGRERVVAFGRA